MKRLLLVAAMVLLAVPTFAAFRRGANSPVTYSTTFPLTENPIYQGGRWLNGAVVGLDWQNVQTFGNLAGGAGGANTGGAQYADPTAILTGSWEANQKASATVYNAVATGCCREVELRLRFNLSAHSATGYEIDCGLDVTNPYYSLVRWNGALNDFTVLAMVTSTYCANGDTLSATAIGSVITAYKNGTQYMQVTDATWATGAPGIGFYDNDSGSEWSEFGFTNFTVGPAP